LLVGAPDRATWVRWSKVVIAQLLGLAETMGGQIAHAVGNGLIVGRVGQAKQCLSLLDEEMRVQERLPWRVRLDLPYYLAIKE